MIRQTGWIFLMLNVWINVSFAGSFDCSVIYDEFENLMNKQYLVETNRYVATITDRLTREEFSALQKGKLYLREDRQDKGVAVIQTNKGTRGKLIFSWDGVPVDGYPPLVLEETIIYGRVADGYAPRRLRPITVKPGFPVDLDSVNVNDPEEDADLIYSVDDNQLSIEAINGATLQFPIESLCKQ